MSPNTTPANQKQDYCTLFGTEGQNELSDVLPDGEQGEWVQDILRIMNLLLFLRKRPNKSPCRPWKMPNWKLVEVKQIQGKGYSVYFVLYK